MSSFKSDQDFRRTARQLGVDEKTLRRWLNTADPDELLPRAAAVVVDNGNSLEKHLGEAVWYIKEDRVREEDASCSGRPGRWVAGHKVIGAVAPTFGVNEEYLGRAVWIMKENRYRQACSLKSDKDIQQAARRLGIDKKKLRRAMDNGGCRRSRWTRRGAGPQEPIMSPRSWDWMRRPCALTCEVSGKRADGQKNSGERARAGWNTLLTLTSDRRTR